MTIQNKWPYTAQCWNDSPEGSRCTQYTLAHKKAPRVTMADAARRLFGIRSVYWALKRMAKTIIIIIIIIIIT